MSLIHVWLGVYTYIHIYFHVSSGERCRGCLKFAGSARRARNSIKPLNAALVPMPPLVKYKEQMHF